MTVAEFSVRRETAVTAAIIGGLIFLGAVVYLLATRRAIPSAPSSWRLPR